MKKIFILLLISINFLFANVGKITSIIGEVIVIRDNQEIIATKGMILELNDNIKTKDNSKALIHLKDETTINVGKKSNLSIKEFVIDEATPANSKASLNFGNGLFRTITGKIGKLNPNRFKIKTKTGSIGIRGTIFDVVVTADITKVGVIQGGVYYIDEKTSNQFDVKVGEKLVYDDEDNEISIVKGPVEETEDITITNDEPSQTKENTENKKEETKEEEKEKESSSNKEEETQNKEQEQQEQQKEEEQKEEENSSNTEQEEAPQEKESIANEKNDEVQENTEETSPVEEQQETQASSNEENTSTSNDNTNNEINTNNTPSDDTPDLTNQNVDDIVEPEQEDIPTSIVENQEPINNDEVEELKKEETINSNPIVVIDTTNSTRENETLEISYSGSDPDDDEITYSISKTTQNGVLTLQDDKVVYIPNENYTGDDEFTIIATDSKGAQTPTTVKIAVEEYNPISQTPTSESSTASSLESIEEVTKEIVGSDNYMQFGFIKDSEGNRTDIFSSGSLTPTMIIEQYISNKTTASYSGEVAAIITDTQNNITTVDNGQINLDFDFGAESFTGNIKIDDNWNANINSGEIQSNQFNSSDISSNTSSTIQDITGNINGNFMGETAQSASGKINLNSISNGSVKASFGATKGE